MNVKTFLWQRHIWLYVDKTSTTVKFSHRHAMQLLLKKKNQSTCIPWSQDRANTGVGFGAFEEGWNGWGLVCLDELFGTFLTILTSKQQQLIPSELCEQSFSPWFSHFYLFIVFAENLHNALVFSEYSSSTATIDKEYLGNQYPETVC